MNTFNTDSFTQKVVADLGKVASGQGGNVNLIPAMPGMGILSTLQQGSQTLAKQGVASSLVNLEDLDSVVLLSGNGTLEERLNDANAQLIIIDGGSMAWNDHTQKALVDFVQDKAGQASIWVVGGQIDALMEALDGKATRFGLVHRSRINAENATPENGSPNKPKP